jgi:hypothetical protein
MKRKPGSIRRIERFMANAHAVQTIAAVPVPGADLLRLTDVTRAVR